MSYFKNPLKHHYYTLDGHFLFGGLFLFFFFPELHNLTPESLESDSGSV